MTREQFVQAIKTEALDTAVRDTIQDLHDSPGRRLEPSLTELQQWYQALDPHTQELV